MLDGVNDVRIQSPIQEAIDELISSGKEIGLQVAVIRDGRLVVDAVSGVADPRTGAVVAGDTLFYAASTAKGVATSLAHVLVERTVLDYDMRLIDVWPEFGSHGKEQVTLRHVLLDTAGVPGVPSDTTVADLCDWDHMCAVIAEEEPWWEPALASATTPRPLASLLARSCVELPDETSRRSYEKNSPARSASRPTSTSQSRDRCCHVLRDRSRPTGQRRMDPSRDHPWTARSREVSVLTPTSPTVPTSSPPTFPRPAR